MTIEIHSLLAKVNGGICHVIQRLDKPSHGRKTIPSLKVLHLLGGLLALATLFGSSTALAEVAVQYHCAGFSQLAGDTRLATLQKVLGLPSTTNLEDIALAKVSVSLSNGLRFATSPFSAALMKPLLSDVAATESLGSFGGGSGRALSFILALHLGTPQVQLWQDSFTSAFGGGESFTSEGFSGRRWNTGGSNSIWMIPAEHWLLVGLGDDFLADQAAYVKQIKATGRPVPALERDWLVADISSTGLAGWFRFLKPARVSVTVRANGDDLQVNARVREAEAIPWKSEPWQIPKNLMKGQIISFSAGQNVAAFLNMNPALAQLACNPLTNQFYLWAGDQMPLLDYLAWPEANASNALHRLSIEAPAALNSELKRFNGTELDWNPKAGKLIWGNMSLFAPALEAVQNNDGEFLFLNCIPISSKGKPVQDALLTQIQGRTNLVYYDWELTGRRLSELQILGKIISNRTGGANSEAIAATFAETQWINGVAALVGNTVTEITRVAPDELSVERQAPLGLTGAELVLLVDWLCDANSGAIHSPPSAGSTAPFPNRH